MTVLQKVKRAIVDYGLLAGGDKVLVAFSGGPDSMALLYLLSRLRRTMKLNVGAVYVNHQIRKRAARQEEKFCRELCERLRVDLMVVSEDIPTLALKEKKSLEETARDFRYATFERLADEHGYDRIALGHHADDQVETVLFRLFRGTGRSGLLGIPVKRGRIIRPLLNLNRQEILAYLDNNQLEYCVDHSNDDIRFARNYLRHKLLPVLQKRLNPQVNTAILNLVETLVPEETFLEREVTRVWRKCVSRTPGGKFKLDLSKFVKYDVWLRRRLLRRCVRAACRSGTAPAKEVVDRVDKLAMEGGRPMSLPEKLRAVIVDRRLLIYQNSVSSFCHRLETDCMLRVDRPSLTFLSRIVARRQVRLNRKTRSKKVVLDRDKLKPPFEVRSIRAGDRFQPLGMKGRKKVGDYLTDRKIPKEYRNEIPVLCDRQGIVWLVGFEIAERTKVDAGTRRVLTVEYTFRKEVDHTTV